MFGTTSATTGLGRSASFSFSQPPATKPFSGTTGGFSFGAGTNTNNTTATPAAPPASTTTAPAGGFSFGAPKPATPAGALFASNPNTNSTAAQPAPPAGALFGASTSASQPAQSSGLFGSTTAGTSGTTTGTGTGLFGSTTAAQKPAAFSFGTSTAQPQPGATTNNTAPAPGGGLFGAGTNSLFGGGGGAANNATAGFGASLGAGGGGLFGPSQSGFQPAAAALQQQQQQASPFARFAYQQKERFNDLPEDARKLVEELDKHITSQLQIKDELRTKDFGSEIRKCAAEWQELDSTLKSLAATLESDQQQSRDVAERVERDRSDQATLYAIATNAREGRNDGSAFVEWLQTYFANLAGEFQQRIARYRNVMETIERHLQALEKRDTFTPQAISDAIHAQHSSFMALAAEVAGLHAEVETLKRDFSKWYQQTHKSFRDPFASMAQLAGSVPP
ncbi:Nucleoporin nup49/NSP49 (Nuclear pore protein nup49/NSP49) [Thecaphora frezii]